MKQSSMSTGSCFLALIACAEAGLFGGSGFLGISREPEQLLDVPFDKIAEDAEADAWNLYEKAQQDRANTNITVQTESNASSLGDMSAASISTTRRAPRAPRNREVMLIGNLKNTGDGGDDTMACVTHCRYGEHGARYPWRSCLERCVENPLMRNTFMKMLPAEHHAAKDPEDVVPDGLELPGEEQLERINHRIRQKMRSSEL